MTWGWDAEAPGRCQRVATFWRGLSSVWALPAGAPNQVMTTFLSPPIPLAPAALTTHWTLDFDPSLSTRPGQLMVLEKYLKVAGPAPSSPPTSSHPSHTTTTLAPLPHDRLDPPSRQLISILHHWPMDCVSRGEGGDKMGPG